tara:strand:- start:3075 stop:3272 length:198 start_codon:yes stop_codon:yes gene_type:complete
MAAVTSTRHAPFGAIATYHTIQFISNFAAMLVSWNDSRTTRKALSKLTDRELDDIGLCRSDINSL